jgi:ComF family protein
LKQFNLLLGWPQVVPKPYFPVTRDLPLSYPHKLLDSILNLVYPDTCFLCSVPVARHQDCGVCASCWDKALALQIKRPRCSCCGIPFHNFEEETEHLCGNCLLQLPPYAAARSFGYYTGELSGLIQGLKFHGRRNLVGLLAPLLVSTFFDSWGREEFDLVVPVPLHSKRRRERGYNQAELLARALSRQIAVSFCADAVVRIRPTLPQVGLSEPQRLENVSRAFRCLNPRGISKMRILLIDDVMTTGATAASAARSLLDSGALRVSVLTLARAEKL